MWWRSGTQHLERTSRRSSSLGAAALATVLLGATAGCSLILDKKTEQCSIDSDCDHFGGHPYCQEGYCVASGLGPEGCIIGTPKSQSDYLNACSTSKCVAFDNCDRLGLCTAGQALPPLVDPQNGTIPPLLTSVPKPIVNCTDGAPGGATPNMIYLFGSSDFGPLLRAAQPSLSALPTPYRAVFQNATSCGGADAVFSTDPTKHVMKDPTGTSSAWAFYYDDNGNQVNCLLDPAGDTVNIGISDLYAQTCDPTYIPGASVSEYTGPVTPFVLSVRATSPEESISAEAAHLVFGLRGTVPANSGMKNAAPWTDPNNYFIRNSGAGSTVLTALTIDVPKAKFWGIDRLTTDNLRDSLLASTAIDQSIGILSIDYNDKNRGNLKALYLQSTGQNCGYQPDSSPTTYDKANVRDGHYPLWGYVHFFTPVGPGGVPGPAANAMVLLFNVQKIEQRLLDDIIGASLTPQCAMQVSRSAEIGDFGPRVGLQCGCYFDFKTKGHTDCQACASAEDCPGQHPCNYGYCELNEND
jgi:hypothetical protein